MKVIAIFGYPGAGKSAVMRGIIKVLEEEGHVFEKHKQGLVTYIRSGNITILGTYAVDEKFPGTDRLPLNVQPEAQNFLTEASRNDPQGIYLFEGDRLTNDSMFSFMEVFLKAQIVLCLVKADKALVQSRREVRSEQNESWRKGRESKVDRIALTRLVHHVIHNNTMEEQEAGIQEILQEIHGRWNPKQVTTTKLKSFWTT